MKIIKIALLALMLCGPAIETAQAGVHLGGGRSATSAAFKSGFSSQKSVLGRTTSDANVKNSSFGSFGANAAPPSPAAPSASSALSRDLNASGANAAALKTFDARNQAVRPISPVPPSYATNPAANPSMLPVAPQAVIVQHSGFSSSPFLWFMLGHSMAGNDHERVVYVNGNGADSTIDQNGRGGANTSAAMAEPKESLAVSLLRIVLWTAFLSAAICGIVYYIARRSARSAKHYSL